MIDAALRNVDFKLVRTIITKEESDLNEWKYCTSILFKMLEQNLTYSISIVIFKEKRNYGYVFSGIPEILLERINEKIQDAKMVFLSIKEKDKENEYWHITRQ